MIVYRFTKEKYADKLSGFGAALSQNNRWNPKGREIVYCSMNIATAMAEILVHLPIRLIPKDYLLLHISIPDKHKIQVLETKDYPIDWNEIPPRKETQQIGNHFLEERKSIALKVRSAVVKGEYNLLINPFHPDFSSIQIIKKEVFQFDQRLFGI